MSFTQTNSVKRFASLNEETATALRKLIRKEIFGAVKQIESTISKAANIVVVKWGAVHWGTYRAILRKQGEYHKTSKGIELHFNDDL